MAKYYVKHDPDHIDLPRLLNYTKVAPNPDTSTELHELIFTGRISDINYRWGDVTATFRGHHESEVFTARILTDNYIQLTTQPTFAAGTYEGIFQIKRNGATTHIVPIYNE